MAQELICHSSLIAQALVDGGLVAKKIVQHQVDSSEDEHESPHTAEPENREDEEAEEIEQPKSKTMVKKADLSLEVDDEDDKIADVDVETEEKVEAASTDEAASKSGEPEAPKVNNFVKDG